MTQFQKEAVHTFEQSGLGKFPFCIVEPKQHPIEKGCVFWCEHCGTQIKNRNFVKSYDGKVSVVGIDCLNKTGDQGLIDGAKRIKREALEAIKAKKRAKLVEDTLEQERIEHDGKTKSELIAELESKIDNKTDSFVLTIEDNPVILSLVRMGFELDMQVQAFRVRPFSLGQLSVIKKIYAKKVSGARANSKAFNAARVSSDQHVDDLQGHLTKMKQVLDSIREQVIDLKNRVTISTR